VKLCLMEPEMIPVAEELKAKYLALYAAHA